VCTQQPETDFFRFEGCRADKFNYKFFTPEFHVVKFLQFAGAITNFFFSLELLVPHAFYSCVKRLKNNAGECSVLKS
jgi:hypothetical protein